MGWEVCRGGALLVVVDWPSRAKRCEIVPWRGDGSRRCGVLGLLLLGMGEVVVGAVELSCVAGRS